MDRVSLGGLVAKIVSFGDSFVLGNELSRLDGTAAWPGLIAQDLGLDFETCAVAGCGNEHIAQQIYQYFSTHDAQGTLAVINWTWCMRWDVYIDHLRTWITLGPTCVPDKLETVLGFDQAMELITFYQSHAGTSDLWNRWRSLQAIWAVQSWLNTRDIKTIQTYIDPSMLESHRGDRLTHYQAFRDPSWPEIDHEDQLQSLPASVQKEIDLDYRSTAMPVYIQELQQQIRPNLSSFEGQGFLDWSRAKGFAITNLLHPLDQAHRAAADFWRATYGDIIAGMSTS